MRGTSAVDGKVKALVVVKSGEPLLPVLVANAFGVVAVGAGCYEGEEAAGDAK